MTRAAAASPRRAAPYQSLRRSSEIGKVRRIGIRRRVGGITIFAAAGEPGLPRVAFVAGRAAGSAVDRNRAKRRMREAVRRVPLREGHDYVVTGDGSVAAAGFDTVMSWVVAALAEE
ncbi:MAG TPA: ribonuclease P protein component [Acidimicrobiia bacterium]|nr:ribonuclease P protein component [Acidimicrobiia bacterium]